MNPGFQSSAIKCLTSDGHNVTVLEDFAYAARDGKVYVVKAGAQSDGASTPRFIWTLIPPFGPWWMPAVLHDFLYRCSTLPKEVCDSLLYEAMIAQGVSKTDAWEIYEGVRLGGQSAFDADRAAQTTAHRAMLALAA